MSFAVHCQGCGETVWPPVDAGGPGGQTEIAACRLALKHVRESGHTDVHVQAGCYYVGDGDRPTAFGGGATDPEDVAVPDRSRMADAVDNAARTLREAAEDVRDLGEGARAGVTARHLEDYAEAVKSNVSEDQREVAE